MNRGKETIFFYFLYKFLEIIDWKWHWATILHTDLDSLLPFKWNWMRQNVPNVATNNINIWFLTHNAFSDQKKLDFTVLLIA